MVRTSALNPVNNSTFVPKLSRAALLGITFLVSYAYFYQGGGWNQNTRFDLVRAIVERQTLQIDVYQGNTGDKAVMDGHYYSDKAPGASLVAVPAVAAVRAILSVSGWDVFSPEVIAGLSYVATFAAAGIPAALAALCVFWSARRAGCDDHAAALAAVICALGTPLFAYATLLYGHALAAGCSMLAFIAAWQVERASGRAAVRWCAVTGAAAGWAVITEFPSSIPSAMTVAVAWVSLRRGDHAWRSTLALGGGLSIGALVLLTYNWLAFGSLFHIGYTSEQAGFDAMKTGIFGVNWPNPRILLSLLFGPYRGLLPLAPVLIVAPIGLWLWMRDRRTRVFGTLAVSIAGYYFLMTSGYAYWDGGWSYGSRHLGPALPFLCVAIAPAWQAAGRIGRMAILMLALVGIGESLVAVATTPQPPGGAAAPASPMRDQLWPAFLSGDFPIGWQSVLERNAPSEPLSELERRGVPRASWNLGQKIGLRGHASLVPLVLVWVVATLMWFRAPRVREPHQDGKGRASAM